MNAQGKLDKLLAMVETSKSQLARQLNINHR